MSESTLSANLPRLPHPEFFCDPAHTIMDDARGALLSYDPTTRAGFIYYVESHTWSITAPVDFITWALLVKASGHTVSDSEDSRRWFKACQPTPASANIIDFPGGTRH